ncbi:MAG: PDZ domain-containing protein [Nitrospinaceae bacterium]|nr:PDZ domain-containing protein [Nitrospinaceae bacterium]NIU96757.1 PDZ domain-containing protein [Nitrospinaceae bacterium]NIW59368.1 PDZ domain-containing protein [Nitrospinaceae bacterium]
MSGKFIFKVWTALALSAWLLNPPGAEAGHSAKGLKVLEEVEKGFVGLAEHTLPSVVNISPYIPPSPSIRRQRDPNRSRPTNAGAGVIIDGVKGYIVTNSHVVRQSDKVQIRFYSGEEMVGHVIGTDEETDLAVIQVKSSKPLPSVSLGDSSKVKVGQFVVAIGNPYGLHDTFSFGVVSGLNRENVNISRYEDFIQTDASINPGNSGGPLLNIRGEVIGINTAIINYAQSIGFAIPSNVVKKVAQQIIETGSVRRGWLGVGIEYIPEDIAKSSNIDTNDGVLINSVFDGQPAAKAGLKVGDIIMKIGGASVKSPNAMIRLIGNFSPGQVVDLKILRNGVAKTFSVRLDRKEDPEHKIAALERNKFSFLGFEWDDISSVSSEKGSGAQGVLVTRVYPHSQAERAGVKSGDVITAVNGQTIADKDGFIRNMRQAPRNELITLQVDRNNTSIQFELKHF